MKTIPRITVVLSCCLLSGGLSFVSCMEDAYDMDNIDKTMALGSDKLQLPIKNSVKDILLDDILDIKDSKSVTIDAEGNYHYSQNSTIDDVNDIKVDKIVLAKAGEPIENPVKIDIEDFAASIPDGTELDFTGASIHDKIETFSYFSNPQDKVVDLTSADLHGEMTLEVYFSSKLRKVVETVDEMSIELPPFMDFEVLQMPGNAVRNGNIITFTNQSTDGTARVKINVTKLDFAVDKNSQSDNCITFDTNKRTVNMMGKATVEATITKLKKRTIADDGYASAAIRSTLTIDDIVIDKATGKFSPDITMKDSNIQLNDLPKFLTEDDVVADLYNPQILLEANSQLPMAGIINLTLVAKKDGAVLKTIEVEDIKIAEQQENHICISRRDENIPAGYIKKIVPNLSEIIETVPDIIEVHITAKADESNIYTIALGQNYSLTDITYSIQAPLAFGEKARVIYSSYEDGWASDMPEDMDFEKGAYIELTANMDSNVPMNLTMVVKAIDVEKNEIANVVCTVDQDIKGSNDGQVVTTPVKVRIERNNNSGKLTDVDGIRFTLEAAADNTLKGQILNAHQHKLTVRDIKATIYGRVIADFN